MNYLLKNKHSKSVHEKLSWGLGVFIGFILIRFLCSMFLSSISYTIAKPFWNLRDGWFGPHTNIQAYFETKNTLIENIQVLKSEIYSLQIKNIELANKVGTLSQELNQHQIQKERIMAKVLSKPPYSPFDTLIIDIGTNQGLSVGTKVFYDESLHIGTVTRVGPEFAETTLFSSGSSVFESRVARTGETISIHGSGGGSFAATIPKGFDISVGDTLVDGSRNQNIIMIVESVDESSQGSFKSIYGRLPINIFNIEWVGIEL